MNIGDVGIQVISQMDSLVPLEMLQRFCKQVVEGSSPFLGFFFFHPLFRAFVAYRGVKVRLVQMAVMLLGHLHAGATQDLRDLVNRNPASRKPRLKTGLGRTGSTNFHFEGLVG
jgi:hypothetical protein